MFASSSVMADSVMADSSASLVREGGSEEGVSAVGIELESVNQSPAAQSQENGETVIIW